MAYYLIGTAGYGLSFVFLLASVWSVFDRRYDFGITIIAVVVTMISAALTHIFLKIVEF